MSFEAIRWALSQAGGTMASTAKLLLVVMADHARQGDPEALCWATCATLAQRCGVETRSIEAALRSLRDKGLIVDTGRREGATGRVIVYRLNTEYFGVITAPAEVQPVTIPQLPAPARQDEIPPISEAVETLNTPEKVGIDGRANTPHFGGQIPPIFAPNTPHSCNLIPPKSSDRISKGISKESGKEPKKRVSTRSLPPQTLGPPARPDDVAEQTWNDWLLLRKNKKAPVTLTVLNHAREQAGLAGIPLEGFLQLWCGRGSQGLMAEWLRPGEVGAWHNTRNGTNGHGRPKNQQELLEESNRQIGLEWIANSKRDRK